MSWGLIGASAIASLHMIGAIRAQPRIVILSVLCYDTERGKSCAARHGIPTSTTDLDTLLANPEIGHGWRINDASAGGGVIPDILVHDADTVRFQLREDPVDAVAIDRSKSLGQVLEENVTSAWIMPSGALVQAHEGATIRHAGSGIKFHRTSGSILAKTVLTQRPIDEITGRDAEGDHVIPITHHNLCERSLGLSLSATNGIGQPSATGIDGVKPLAVALAVKQAATTGQRTTVDYGGH